QGGRRRAGGGGGGPATPPKARRQGAPPRRAPRQPVPAGAPRVAPWTPADSGRPQDPLDLDGGERRVLEARIVEEPEVGVIEGEGRPRSIGQDDAEGRDVAREVGRAPRPRRGPGGERE